MMIKVVNITVPKTTLFVNFILLQPLGLFITTLLVSQRFFYFSDECDIALGLSTDSFAPFEKCDKTCWPIILFNYNLHPNIWFQKKYCIHVALVPGPKKPWDWDLFFWPLIQELIQLEQGVKAFDAIIQALFLLHTYLIFTFGDIPTMALIMHLKGQNGIRPCLACNIKGIHLNS